MKNYSKTKIYKTIFKAKIRYNSLKYRSLFVFCGFFIFFIFSVICAKFIFNEKTIQNSFGVSAKEEIIPNELTSVKRFLENKENINDSFTNFKDYKKITSDIGFVDLRILALKDYFRYYNSPLEDYADDFILASEKYQMDNWQLLPAIALAETLGCRTGISHAQRNCWGWGGSGSNRVEFPSYDVAIDFITYRMVKGYTNKYLNAKDIQNTYCGQTCAKWGYRWARGVNYYVIKINDFGEKYSLPRTNELQGL